MTLYIFLFIYFKNFKNFKVIKYELRMYPFSQYWPLIFP